MTCDVTLVINWGRSLEMFSISFSKNPCWFTYILLITFQPFTLVPVYDVTLFSHGILVFWCHQVVFDCFASSKVNLVCHVSYICFWNFHWGLLCMLLLWCSFWWLTWTCCLVHFCSCFYCFWMVQEHLIFCLILFKAQLGYLQDMSAFWRGSCFSSMCCLVEHTSLALWNNVLMTLYLAVMAWWLSHCKYWLVWVGFLYTVVGILPSACGVTWVSRKGIDPSALVFSAVNWMPSSMEFIWLKNSSLSAVFMFLCFCHIQMTLQMDTKYSKQYWEQRSNSTN